jgi:2-polyprenyl-3-methyl-5-hydroxy-6-metoxy-1,4-benzoquinol methylase
MDYLSQTYAKMASELDPTEEYFETDSRFMTLERILRSIPAGRMCDIGCGRGALIKRLEDYHDVSGCDFENAAVEACIAKGLPVRQIDLNSAQSLPFDSRFDTIVISEVCEHLLNPRNALQVAHKGLVPDGLLVVTVPNAIPLFVRIGIPFGKTISWLHYPSGDTEKAGHIRFYTMNSMSRLLEEEGFKVTDVMGVSFRMNGFFWERVCFWIPTLLGMKHRWIPARIDAWLGRRLPALSPGLLFTCRRF